MQNIMRTIEGRTRKK